VRGSGLTHRYPGIAATVFDSLSHDADAEVARIIAEAARRRANEGGGTTDG